MSTIVTTGGRPDDHSRLLAQTAAEKLHYPMIERHKRSVAQLQQQYESDVLVAGKNRYELYRIGMKEPFFFHPNSAAFRLKRLLNGESDPMIEACGLRTGDTFLDCTLGLASDSILASFTVGTGGKVLGIEGDPDVAFITATGLKTFPAKFEELVGAMDRIEVIQSEAIDFLRQQPEAAWDVVYIDPMFHQPIEESSNFTPLRTVGMDQRLTAEWVEQALRVCKRRIVVKDRFDSPAFDLFKLERTIRPTSKFHYGRLSK
ncbi:class I SAM-dependent methyltransferase [Sporosarcina sp. HYO08]|uniref:class I SAM-dependent methyltransferase n=1 Tax=Sporosarcina sp. HYO08 TaxID=1759557 RepID=UPI0026D7E2E3